MKISVIIPVCNVEKYLKDCIESVLKQSLTDMEVILIDDGSKDDSWAIIQDFMSKDKRIIGIHKKNEGYGKTLNLGLAKAKGDYISIIESDDFIDQDMFEYLYNLANKFDLDLVKSSFYKFTDGFDDHQNVMLFFDHTVTDRVICARNTNCLSVLYAMPSIWTAIYKRSFLQANNIMFLETPGASFQDTSFTYKALICANRILVTNKAFYHYRQHANQSVKSNSKVFCVCDEWHEVSKFIHNYPYCTNASVNLINRLKFSSYLWNYERLSGEKQEEFRKVFAEEFTSAINAGEFSLETFFDYEKIRILHIFYPKKLKYTFLYQLYRIRDILFYFRIKNGRISWYLKYLKAKFLSYKYTDKRIWPTFYEF